VDSESDALQTIGPVELQKIGVVPNTIFLGSRQTRTADLTHGTRKISVSGGRVLSHASSFDRGTSGVPLEDLKRRLATINGSNTSLGSGRGRTVSAAAAVQRPLAIEQDLPNTVDFRPGSPTESVVSTVNSSIKPRFSVGSIESQKAAPAVGSVRANAIVVQPPQSFSHPERKIPRINLLARKMMAKRQFLVNSSSNSMHP